VTWAGALCLPAARMQQNFSYPGCERSWGCICRIFLPTCASATTRARKLPAALCTPCKLVVSLQGSSVQCTLGPCKSVAHENRKTVSCRLSLPCLTCRCSFQPWVTRRGPGTCWTILPYVYDLFLCVSTTPKQQQWQQRERQSRVSS
jgi:hypothetical protein